MDKAEFIRWYGPWRPTVPSEVEQILAGIATPWWVVGGWAIEAFTGQEREHEDIDVAILRDDLPVVLERLLQGYCAWSNLSGSLRPLRAASELPPGCRQIWVRRDAGSPWHFDLLLTPHEGDHWVSIRDDRIRRSLAESVFMHEGIRYLRPEMVLHLKAKGQRSKDDGDFAAAVPLLGVGARRWLRTALEIANPGHPWLERLA